MIIVTLIRDKPHTVGLPQIGSRQVEIICDAFSEGNRFSKLGTVPKQALIGTNFTLEVNR